MSVDLDFDTIQDLMIRGELSGSAAEVHGHLSGMLCMDTATCLLYTSPSPRD